MRLGQTLQSLMKGSPPWKKELAAAQETYEELARSFLSRVVLCWTCGGKGHYPHWTDKDFSDSRCPACDGVGFLAKHGIPCGACGSTGRTRGWDPQLGDLPESDCPTCAGMGFVAKEG